jgi:hypothetical protein
MIKIIKNPNFSEWFNISLDGKVLDNARTRAEAFNIASKIKKNLRKQIKTGARIVSSIERV